MDKKNNTPVVKAPDQVPQENLPPTLTGWEKKRKIILLVIAFIGFNLFIWGTLYYSIVAIGSGSEETNTTSGNQSDLVEIGVDKNNKVSPIPTPFLFQEMTIPYLRLQDFNSSLGELSQVSQNSEYTSYLASYDSDGFKVNGLLTIPVGEAPDGGWPAIVFVHGYIPPQNYKTLTNYASYVDYLARRGFVVFKIDLRGHADSEGEAGGGYFSGDYIIDTLNARSALQNSDFVNQKKVGLWGHSMAGNVVSRSLAAEPSIPAIVIWAGAVYTYEDFYDLSIQDSSYQPPAQESERRKKREELFQTHGTFSKNSEFWSQVPMTNYLDGITGAISLNHAVNDPVVDISYSRNFNELLNQTNIVHELNEYSSGGHNLTGNVFNQAMQNTVDFFNEQL